MISTKGRYALRFLIDVAEQGASLGADGSPADPPPRPVPLGDVARRQGISAKYLQHIAKLLVDRGLLKGVSGKGGGYLLACSPTECSVAAVLEATEGTLAPVACLACGEGEIECDRANTCKTLPLWKRYDELTHGFFASVTIADLADGTFTRKQET